MSILEYFRRVPTLSAAEVRQLLAEKKLDEYNLIDVRTPQEYEDGHLPGAELMPLDSLADRAGELDREKTTVTYCRSGVRSRAGAACLVRAGFRKVYSMAGGIQAWEGAVVKGAPEPAMVLFAGAGRPEELIALAWLLEDGSYRFYAEMAKTEPEGERAGFYEAFAAAERRHKGVLEALFGSITGGRAEGGFPQSLLAGEPPEAIMEGRMRVGESIQWARGRALREVLEFCAAVEANAWDLYAVTARETRDEKAGAVFRVLAEEEKAHLEQVSRRLEAAL